jgi:hypothetical protein
MAMRGAEVVTRPPTPKLFLLAIFSVLSCFLLLIRVGGKVLSWLRQQLARLRFQAMQHVQRNRFAVLVRLALQRLLHHAEGDQEEVGASTGALLGVLALPGGFVSVMLFEKYGGLFHYFQGVRSFQTLNEALSDEYFFIAFTIVVCGAIAVWKWDQIFPDRRDYMTLVPLPLSSLALFVSNVVALALFAGLFAVDVNAVSAVLFPWVVCAATPIFRFFVMFALTHALAVLLASLFSFLAVFATVGTLMAILPERLFRRVSVLVRSIYLTGLLALLFTVPIVPAHLQHLETSSKLLWTPAVWFLGICQVVRGQYFGGWPQAARIGTESMLAAIAICCVTYSLAYRRYFLRIPERIEVIAGSRSLLAHAAGKWADRWLLRTPFQRACYRFAFKTLCRSERHRLLVTGLVAIGAMISFGLIGGELPNRASTLPSAMILAAPLPLIVAVLVALRMAFDVGADLRAKWIFQITLGGAKDESVGVARKLMLSFTVPWIWIIVLPAYSVLWDWRVGLLHAATLTAAATLVTDLLLLNFHKIPFTHAAPPFGQNVIARVLVEVLAFALGITLLVQLELWALRQPAALLALLAMFSAGWIGIARYRAEQPQIDGQLFDDAPKSAFELLNLTER